jgi:hypothetical protein
MKPPPFPFLDADYTGLKACDFCNAIFTHIHSHEEIETEGTTDVVTYMGLT